MTDKEIAQLYREMELELIDSMKRNLGLHLAEEAETGLDYPQWQAIKLRELRKYQEQNSEIISGKLNRLPEEVAKQLRDELNQGYESEIKRFRSVIGKGKYKEAVAMSDSFFKVDALIEEVNGRLFKANHAALRMANDVYRDVIFKTGMFVSNGVMTEQQAYDMAMKDFLNRGLNCIEYKDGRRVNIADYTSMAVRTANQRAYMMGEGEFRKEIGNPLVIISRHNTSCELCAPFQNKVLIDDVYSGGTQDDGDYMLMSEAMDKGLFHPRCRHGLSTYYPEIDEIDREYDDYTEHDITDYGEHNQAYAENMIQKYKRLSHGSLDPKNVSKYEAKLREWEGKKKDIDLIWTDDYKASIEKEKKIIKYQSSDREMFSRYKDVLKGLAPDTLEKFVEMKYTKIDEWSTLKKRYLVAKNYKIDSGYIDIQEILRLDNVVITEKRNQFVSKFKKSGNIAGAYLDNDTDNMFYAHSTMNESSKGYKGTSNIVLLKGDRHFKYKDVSLPDGTLRSKTYYDTEAKLFEYFADLYETTKFKSITMLSERGMCDSCKNVMKQFKETHPDVKINVVSNKRVEGNVWKYRRVK